ncbi:MAG: hypothetical protein H7X92_07380 [Chitinophagales bacterium]|nr:hypothetical protein [Hyphomicrobiales bacterium]
MRGFLLTLTILSLLATGGIFAWRTLAPEGPETFSSAQSDRPIRDGVREFREQRRAERQERRQASARQDWAMIASVGSSIVSAIAALLQAWFGTRRS